MKIYLGKNYPIDIHTHIFKNVEFLKDFFLNFLQLLCITNYLDSLETFLLVSLQVSNYLIGFLKVPNILQFNTLN